MAFASLFQQRDHHAGFISRQRQALQLATKLAVLDVDDLLYSTRSTNCWDAPQLRKERFNHRLLRYLKYRGYTKVILFTAMGFRSELMMHSHSQCDVSLLASRQNIIRLLKEDYSLDVIAVETPACPSFDHDVIGMGYEAAIKPIVQSAIEDDVSSSMYFQSLFSQCTDDSEKKRTAMPGEPGHKDRMALHVCRVLNRYCLHLQEVLLADDRPEVLLKAAEVFQTTLAASVVVKKELPTIHTFSQMRDNSSRHRFDEARQTCTAVKDDQVRCLEQYIIERSGRAQRYTLGMLFGTGYKKNIKLKAAKALERYIERGVRLDRAAVVDLLPALTERGLWGASCLASLTFAFLGDNPAGVLQRETVPQTAVSMGAESKES